MTIADGAVPEEVLAELDADRAVTERKATDLQETADAWQARADDARRLARDLGAVRAYMAERVGRPWDDVRAEIRSDAAKADSELAEAEEELRRVQEEHRDAVGAVRYLRRKIAPGAS